MAIPNRQIHARLRIYRANNVDFVDVTPWVARAEVNLGDVSSIGTGSSGGDGVARQLSVTIHQDVNNRFSPLDDTSPYNFDGGIFAPLLYPNRQATLEVAFSDPNGPVGPYRMLFRGLLGDVIRTDGDTVELEIRDLSKQLQDRFITGSREYGAPIDEGGVRADLVIQQIIDDEFGPGAITVDVPVPPPFFCPPFRVEYQTVWDAIQGVAAQFGWFLGYVYDAGLNDFVLRLFEPPRTKNTGDFHFVAEEDIYVHGLDITDRNVRNSVLVVYRDESGARQEVSVDDPASIAEFGLRPMQIDEANTMLIKNAVQALELAQLALQDLSNLRGTSQLELPLFPELDLYATVTVDDPRISTQSELYGIDSLRHTLDFAGGRFATEAIASNRVVGAYQRWLQMQTRPGSRGNPTEDVWPVRPNTVITVAAHDSADEAKRRADIVCDGRADQDDIMRALDRLPLEGGTIQLLEGTYIISQSIVISGSAQIIQGMGPSTVIMVDDAPDYDPMDDWLTMVFVEPGAGFHCGLRNLVLDGNRANVEPIPVQGIEMYPAPVVKEFTLENVTIRNCSANGVIVGTSLLPTFLPVLLLDNVTITNCAGGLILDKCDARISNSRIVGSGGFLQDGIYFSSGTSLTLVNTDVIGFTGNGIVCTNGGKSIAIHGGRIHGEFGNVLLWNVQDILIDGPRLPPNFAGHSLEIFGDVDPALIPKRIHITNTEITQSAATGIRIELTEDLIDEGEALRDIEISNCQIFEPVAQGIFVRGANGVLIQGCNIQDTGTQAVNTVQVRGMRMLGNYIYRAGQEGLLTQDTSDSVINGNDILESGHHGISMSDFAGSGLGSVGNEVTENRIEASSQNADRLSSNVRLFVAHQNNIQSNILRMGGLANRPIYGIWIGSGADRNFVSNNDAYQAGADDDVRNDSATTVTAAGNRTTTSSTSWTYTRNYGLGATQPATVYLSLSGDGPATPTRGANATLIPYAGIIRRADYVLIEGGGDFDLRLYMNGAPTGFVFAVRGQPAGTVWSIADQPFITPANAVLHWQIEPVGGGPVPVHAGCLVTSFAKK